MADAQFASLNKMFFPAEIYVALCLPPKITEYILNVIT